MTMANSAPVLAKAVLGALSEAIDDLHKVAFFSNKIKIPCEEDYYLKTIEKTQAKFSSLKENSTVEDYNAVLCLFREIPDLKCEVKSLVGVDSLMELCSILKKIGDHLRLKTFAPNAKSLFKMKSREASFQQKYEQFKLTLDYLQKECEELSARKNEAVAAQIAKRQSESRAYSAEDFKSQHSYFVRANAEEEIDFITQTGEEKLFHLKKVQEKAETTLELATLKHREEFYKLIEETVNTRIFIDWITERRKEKLKANEEELNQLWKEFSEELMTCRDLCIKCKEMEEEYNKIIEEEKTRKENATTLDAVATIKVWIRRYIAKKKCLDTLAATDPVD